MSTTEEPPISTSPIRITLVSCRKLRLASLKGSGMPTASATPAIRPTSSTGGSAPSPTAASTTGPGVGARTTWKPRSRSFASTAWSSSSVAFA